MPPEEARLDKVNAQTIKRLEAIFTNLRSKHDKVRERAAQELRQTLEAQIQASPGEGMRQLERIVNNNLFQLFRTQTDNRLGGLLALQSILDLEFLEHTVKVARFIGFITICLPTDNVKQAQLAATALGRLARIGGALANDVVESEAKRALEWLVSEKDTLNRRYCALLILRELTLSVPSLLFQRVEQFIEAVWTAFRDPSLQMREAALLALRAYLSVIADRDSPLRPNYYASIYANAIKGLKGKPESQHGSLLVLGELLKYTKDDFMKLKFRETCDTILRFKDQKHAQIRTVVLRLIPRLAEFQPTVFRTHYLKEIMQYLLNLLRAGSNQNPTDRENAFLALGDLARAMGISMLSACSIESIIAVLRSGLQSAQHKPKDQVAIAALQCLSRLCQSCTADMTPHMVALLELVFALGLSLELTVALAEICQAIPNLLSTVQDMLLDAISRILAQVPYRPLGAVTKAQAQKADPVQDSEDKTSLLLLALKTLGTFDMRRHILCEEVKDHVLQYFYHESPAVRKQAVLTACSMMNNDTEFCYSRVYPKLFASLQHSTALARTVVANIGDPTAGGAAPDRSPTAAGIPPTMSCDSMATDGLGLESVPSVVPESAASFCLSTIATQDVIDVDFDLQPDEDDLRSHFPSGSPDWEVEVPPAHLPWLDPFQAPLSMEQEYHLLVNVPHHRDNMNAVLFRVLDVAVYDSEPNIRQATLASLAHSPLLHPFLAQDEALRALLCSLNDEAYPHRELALGIIARIAHRNPSMTLPRFRKAFLQMLTTLEFGSQGVGSTQDECAQMMSQLILAAPSAVGPHVPRLLSIILSRLAGTSSLTLTANLLQVLDSLAEVGVSELHECQGQLLPLVLNTLHDQSSSFKKQKAFRALGHIVFSGGNVVQPYLEYPKLMPMLLKALHGSSKEEIGIRTEVMKVLGIIGALDPLKYKRLTSNQQRETDKPGGGTGPRAAYKVEVKFNANPEEVYSAVSLNAMLDIIHDDTLKAHHKHAMSCILATFKALGLNKAINFIPYVLPPLLKSIREANEPSLVVYLVQKLKEMMQVVKQHLRGYLPDIVELIKQFWRPGEPAVIQQMVSLVETMRIAFNEEFKCFLPWLVPRLVEVIQDERTERRELTVKILNCFEVMGNALEDFRHLVLSAICDTLCDAGVAPAARQVCLSCLSSLCKQLDFQPYCAQLLNAIQRVLLECLETQRQLHHSPTTPTGPTSPVELTTVLTLQPDLIAALCAIIENIGSDYLMFHPHIASLLAPLNLTHQRFEEKLAQLKSGGRLRGSSGAVEGHRLLFGQPVEDLHVSKPTPMEVNPYALKKAWEISLRATQGDWNDWMSHFAAELLKQSPSPALRACAALAQRYPPVTMQLFNSAFMSCYNDLSLMMQMEMIKALNSALNSPKLSAEALQVLLNLAEFMEHDVAFLNKPRDGSGPSNPPPSPFDGQQLGDLAFRAQLYAKALRYKEATLQQLIRRTADAALHSVRRAAGAPEQFTQKDWENAQKTCEHLISINNELSLPQSAAGILVFMEKHAQGRTLATRQDPKESPAPFNIHPEMYEQLGRWDEALAIHEANREKAPGQLEHVKGIMRCLMEIGRWDRLFAFCKDLSKHLLDENEKKELTYFFADCGFNVGDLAFVREVLPSMKKGNPRTFFYNAVLAIHDKRYSDALKYIHQTRLAMDNDVSALVGESYTRAYDKVVGLQELTELEEVISYKTAPSEEKQQLIRRVWGRRLLGMEENVTHWQRMLTIQSLVLSPEENLDSWLRFVALCEKSSKPDLALRTLMKLFNVHDGLSEDPEDLVLSPAVPPEVVEHYVEHAWQWGDRPGAFAQLQRFTAQLPPTNAALRARCRLKLGQWMQHQHPQSYYREDRFPPIMEHLQAATQLDPDNGKCWHAWALLNQRVARQYCLVNGSPPGGPHTIHLANAVHGFVQSVHRSSSSSVMDLDILQQDILRILTIWFDYGQEPEVEAQLRRGFNLVNIDTWLLVIPQIIARIHATQPAVREMISEVLCRIGKVHPQALIYPLTVATKTTVLARKAASQNVLENMREHSATLVQQAQLVSSELIRTAILWAEQWYEALEDASRLYFGEHNVEGMLNVLQPLHEMINHPETKQEMAFQQAFGGDLRDAQACCNAYRSSRNQPDLNQAWDLYYNVFRRISKQLQQMHSLELQFVSPALEAAHDLELCIPGQYRPNAPLVRIAGFAKTLKVIPSKQRPRRTTIMGSDGNEYKFLLKGHEDLRQDERVMQLFGLVNTLLANDRDTSYVDLSIEKYPVIPLSGNAGLIGWLDHAETFHSLIREYRENKKIKINSEHLIMMQMTSDYDHLSLIQKVEVFEHALENTDGQDLNKVLWLHSENSELWLDRRNNYIRSLAAMSMVGYILGLGDRHPSNLMLQKHSRKVVHIDFGDCFEVAMHREKYPEKIPFRLTRMLINAMEVAGVDGTFKHTSVNVMKVLRKNRDSLMALLEAFVHDPLINWRLVDADKLELASQAKRPQQKRIETAYSFDQEGKKDEQDKFSRSVKEKQIRSILGDGCDGADKEEAGKKEKAMAVIKRIRQKLEGTEFPSLLPTSFPDARRAAPATPCPTSFTDKVRAEENARSAGPPSEGPPSAGQSVTGPGPGLPSLHSGASQPGGGWPEARQPSSAADDAEVIPLTVAQQVDKLIAAATSHENLCQCYIGWCPFW